MCGRLRRRDSGVLRLFGGGGTGFATLQRRPVFIFRRLVVGRLVVFGRRVCLRLRLRLRLRGWSCRRRCGRSGCRWWWSGSARRTGRGRGRLRRRGRLSGRLGRFRLIAATAQDRRTLVLVQAARHRRRWFLLGLRLEGACRLPGAFGHPLGCLVCIFPLQRTGYGKQSLRNPGEHTFINRIAPKRHGHGSSLVGAGIVVFSVDENRNWNEMGLAIRRQLKQAQSTRTFGGLRRVRSLRKQLWRERAL